MENTRVSQKVRRAPDHSERRTDDVMLDEVEYDDGVAPPRMPTSARRYQSLPDVRSESGRRHADAQGTGAMRTTIPPRRTATQTGIPAVQGNRGRPTYADEEEDVRRTSGLLTLNRRPRFHWLVFVGLGIFIMILGWFVVNAVGNWWQVTQDDMRYGRPRTFQMDYVVGHNDSPANPSHFIAINLNRHIMIIEIPGGNAAKSRIYTGPILIGPGQDLTPATLQFQDVNGDGKVDMIVVVQGSRFVFLNENGIFVPQNNT